MTAPVLVFDSGSGGLSVWREMRRRRPDLATIYAADFAGLPYGTKTDQALIERIETVLHPLIRRWQPALVVVACNTASTLVLEQLRRDIQRPFVGVVPAIKVAAAAAGEGRILLLATSATISRPYIDRLVSEFAPTRDVRRLAADELVSMAEARVRGRAQEAPPGLARLRSALMELSPHVVVLGCTHFPLLIDWLRPLQPQAQWLDCGEAIARRVDSLLPPVQGDVAPFARHVACYSGDPDPDWEHGLADFGFSEIQRMV